MLVLLCVSLYLTSGEVLSLLRGWWSKTLRTTDWAEKMITTVSPRSKNGGSRAATIRLPCQWLQFKAVFTLNFAPTKAPRSDYLTALWQSGVWLRYPFCSAHCSAPCSALAGALSVAHPNWCARCENNMIANISAQTALICLYIIVYKSCCVTLFLFCLLDLEWAKLWQQIHQGNHLNYLPLEDIVSKFFTNILILMLFRHQWQQETNYTGASQ